MSDQPVFKKASVNGKPALVQMESRKYAALPDFHKYLEVDCGSVVGAENYRGEVIGLFWQPIIDADRVHLEQDLTL